ncbi:MAG: hypothetical protein WD231_00175 [Candidatus Woykebacteria bacterium]
MGGHIVEAEPGVWVDADDYEKILHWTPPLPRILLRVLSRWIEPQTNLKRSQMMAALVGTGWGDAEQAFVSILR